MRPDLLELSDVVVLILRRRHERPQLLLFVLSDIEESSADRRQQPFVEARPVVVGAEIIALEWEMRERVSPIDQNFDSARPREIDELANRHDLAGEIRDVRNLYDSRPRSDGCLELIDDVSL